MEGMLLTLHQACCWNSQRNMEFRLGLGAEIRAGTHRHSLVQPSRSCTRDKTSSSRAPGWQRKHYSLLNMKVSLGKQQVGRKKYRKDSLLHRRRKGGLMNRPYAHQALRWGGKREERRKDFRLNNRKNTLVFTY